MKQIYKYIAMFFVGMVALSACTEEVVFQDMEEGNEVILNLSVKPEIHKEIVNSRATADENKLYDLHFYVFNAQGKLTGYEKLVSATGEIASPGLPDPIPVTIRTKTGTSYIYAVANINDGSTYYLSDTNKALLNVTPDATGSMTESAVRAAVDASSLNMTTFLGINFNRKFGSTNELYSPDPSDNRFMMSGYLRDGESVTIQKAANGNVSISEGVNVIKLYRILAKNTFTITSFSGEGKKGTFTPKLYRLCNVPKTGVLIPRTGISNPATYVVDNSTTAEVESSFRWNFEGKQTITFYYPENLRSSKVNSITQWKDREKNSWNQTNNTKTFTNAHDNAAYIEIQGDFVDTSGKITANVSYTIHFGDFSAAKKSQNDFTDFNVIRNHAYSYNVIVNGVDDIKVEAQTTTGEDNPYAEGLIVNAEAGEHYSVDAHYEARVMTFTKSSYEDLKRADMGYFLSINTPFGNTKEPVYVKSYLDNNSQTKYGVFNVGNQRLCDDINNITQADLNRIFDNTADYTWLKFVRNTTNNQIGNNSISRYVCKYPGDQWSKSAHTASNDNNKPNQPWLNVFELLAELYNESTYNQNGNSEVYYTCFVDENYYSNKSWPQYVDQEPRTMLIANDLDISPDGKSIYAEVAYSISQKSITTFYRTDYIYPDNTGDLVKAFGTEIIDEEKDYEAPISSQGTFSSATGKNRDWDAWSTSNATFINSNWYNNYSSAAKTIGIQPLYTTAAKGCLSRNRDLDGDGTVDTEEVKWYLASVGQYRGLFIGQNALNEDAYLVKSAELDEINDAFLKRNNGSGWGTEGNYGHEYRAKYHFYTSSASGAATFWPEEGLTNNSLNTSWSQARLVRCVRTLESGGDGRMDPERYYTFANNTFDLGGIVATRNRTDDPLPVHNEIQKANNLYSSFVVAQADMRNTYLTRDISGLETDYCSGYAAETNNDSEKNYKWRTPNQKEYALMSSHVSNLHDDQGIRTKFSGSYDDVDPDGWGWHNTVGFWGQGDVINVGSNASTTRNSVYIRCVRDGQ